MIEVMPRPGQPMSDRWAAVGHENPRARGAVGPTKYESSLESGIGRGLKFAIRFVSESADIPEQDRRERDRLLDLPFERRVRR